MKRNGDGRVKVGGLGGLGGLGSVWVRGRMEEVGFDKQVVTMATAGYHSNLDLEEIFNFRPSSSFKLEYSLQIIENNCHDYRK